MQSLLRPSSSLSLSFFRPSLSLFSPQLQQQKSLFSYSPSLFQIKLEFGKSAEEITKETENLIDSYRKIVDNLTRLTDPSFDDLVVPLSSAENQFLVQISSLEFPQYVSPDSEVRDASSQSGKKLSNFFVEMGMDPNLYRVVDQYSKKGDKLEGEDERFVSRLLRDFKRNGLNLPPQKQQDLKAMKKRISELGIDFQRNINEDTSSIIVPQNDLKGLPEDFIESLECAEDDYNGPENQKPLVLTTQYPHAFPLLRQCSVEKTRKEMEFAFSNRCAEKNVPIAEEIFSLRHDAAKLLGYEKWADFILEIRMAKKLDQVQKFYDSIQSKLDSKAKEELKILLELKRKEKEKENSFFDGKMNAWDFGYYSAQLVRQCGVDEEEIKHYFPTERVISETLNIYQELLDLEFEAEDNAPFWHSDVSCYRVKDKSKKELKGYFYLDLHPREGKYPHAAIFPLQASCLEKDGKRQVPVVAMVCNFPKASSSSPSLLRHSDFVTFFHEFGHAMHGVLGHTKYSRFSGCQTERDFVECPSQTLENWCWQPQILKRVSQHHETKETLPDKTIEKMIESKKLNSSLFYLRQIFLGLFDLTLHSQRESNTESLYQEMRTRLTHVEHTPGTNPTGNFSHIIQGYSASYYSYLWAEVFSSDIFSLFEESGIMDSDLGARYRKEILEKGGSENAELYLKRLLKRDPSTDAFLKHLGIDE